MKWETYHLELLTRTFISGADPRKAEIRIPSIRGQVRWWFRVLGGSKSEEAKLYGGVHGDGPSASKVRMRLVEPVISGNAVNLEDLRLRMGDPQAYLLWPFRPQPNSDQRRGMLKPSTKFTLQVSHRRETSSETIDRSLAALHAWMLFGSLGTRGNRGYGSVWPAGNDIPRPLSSFQDLKEAIRGISQVFPRSPFKVLNMNQGQENPDNALDVLASWLKSFRATKYIDDPHPLARSDHDGKNDRLYRPVLGLPLVQRYSRGPTYQTFLAGSDRWASPVHLKVIRLDNRYFPLVLFFPEMAIRDGAQLTLKERHGPSRPKNASRELFNEMMKPKNGMEVLWDSVT